jgi:hypothetical protein
LIGSLRECFTQQFEALGASAHRILLAFEFERYPTTEFGVVQQFCDAVVIDVEGVPSTAAIVGLGLQENGLVGEFVGLADVEDGPFDVVAPDVGGGIDESLGGSISPSAPSR